MSLEPGRGDLRGAEPDRTEPGVDGRPHGTFVSMGTRPDPLIASRMRSARPSPRLRVGGGGIGAAAFAAMLLVAGILAAVALLAPVRPVLLGTAPSPSSVAVLGGESGASPPASAAAITAPAPSASPSATPVATDILSPAASPTQVVAAFYRLVAEHRFADAAALETPAMRSRYSPSEYIDRRFAHTTRISIERLATSRVTGSSAVVSVRFVEYRTVSPSWVRYWGSWSLARVGGRWLLSASHF